MTLSTRNRLFGVGILISLGALLILATAVYRIIPHYPDRIPLISRRSVGIIQSLLGRTLAPVPYVPLVTIAAAIIYALTALTLIYSFFEKTQTPEILFVAFFVLSFSFEVCRIMIPLGKVFEFPILYLILATRVLIFARYFGIFSLFTASLAASGLEMQKPGNTLWIIAIPTLIIAAGIPIDGFSWDSSLSMVNTYEPILKLVENALIVITAAGFFISAYSRGSREFILIGLGSLLVFLGRSLLFRADTWVSPLPGLAILVLGTWFLCNQLHRIYLWS